LPRAEMETFFKYCRREIIREAAREI